MATVYLARDLRHLRPVALKLLHPELGSVLAGERFARVSTNPYAPLGNLLLARYQAARGAR